MSVHEVFIIILCQVQRKCKLKSVGRNSVENIYYDIKQPYIAILFSSPWIQFLSCLFRNLKRIYSSGTCSTNFVLGQQTKTSKGKKKKTIWPIKEPV